MSKNNVIIEHEKVLNLLNEANDSKFVTENRTFSMVIQGKNPAHEIPCSIEVLKSSLCDYNDAYISVRGDITIIGHHVTQVAFKSCAPFKKYITQIDK